MATRTGKLVNPPTLRALLAVDALFEFAVAALAFTRTGDIARWLDVSEPFVLALGIVFAAAGAWVAFLALAGARSLDVNVLAIGNVAGGALGWVLVLALWGRFEPSGRWLATMVLDMAIALGVAQWLTLRWLGAEAAPGGQR